MLDQTRKELCLKLIDECNAVFRETIEKKITFSDAHALAYWGERPIPEHWFDEPWINWKDVPDEILNRCCDSLSFIRFEDSLFYLVAYMRFTLKGEFITKFVGCFESSTLSFIGINYERFEELKLTDKQKKFIDEFIKYFIQDSDSREWINIHRKKPLSKNDFL